jgi:hypothetical protein
MTLTPLTSNCLTRFFPVILFDLSAHLKNGFNDESRPNVRQEEGRCTRSAASVSFQPNETILLDCHGSSPRKRRSRSDTHKWLPHPPRPARNTPLQSLRTNPRSRRKRILRPRYPCAGQGWWSHSPNLCHPSSDREGPCRVLRQVRGRMERHGAEEEAHRL